MRLVSIKKFANLSILLYVIVVIVAGFYLYRLPDVLLNNTKAVGLIELNEIKPFLNQVNIIVAFLMLVGFLAIILTSASGKKGSEENVIYVESFEKKKEDIKAESQQKGENDKKGQKHSNIKSGIEEIKNNEKPYDQIFNDALSLVCSELEASQAAAYYAAKEGDHHFIQLFASYAYPIPESEIIKFEYGEGLAGQAAKEKKLINLDNVPEGYIRILSGLGSASPTNLIIIPILNEQEDLLGVVEIASFNAFTEEDEKILKQVFYDLGGSLKPQQV